MFNSLSEGPDGFFSARSHCDTSVDVMFRYLANTSWLTLLAVRMRYEVAERRLAKGQHFQQPVLGCREFPAIVEPIASTPDADALVKLYEREQDITRISLAHYLVVLKLASPIYRFGSRRQGTSSHPSIPDQLIRASET
jgi:hypothetical protein